jgi:hypothetical protein
MDFDEQKRFFTDFLDKDCDDIGIDDKDEIRAYLVDASNK